MASQEWKLLLVVVVMIFTAIRFNSATNYDEEIKLTYSTPEEKPVGFVVGNIYSSLSKQQNSDLHITNFILVKSPYSPLFSLNKDTSSLSVHHRIDREEICEEEDEEHLDLCVVSLQVICKSQVNQFLVIKVKVVITDINDNYPKFQSDTDTIRVPEDLKTGSKFIIPTAKDEDSKIFNINYYTIQNCDDCRFSLKTENTDDNILSKLYIQSNDRMNRRLNPIHFDVLAVDKGNPSKSGRLRVVVHIDETNQPPRFEKDSYEVTFLEEMMTSKPIVKVQATDSDNGSNGKIVYYLAKPDIYGYLFQINSKTGDIYLKNKLNFELKSYYKVKIMAKDSGTPALSASSTLLLHVADANDHPPKITLTSNEKGDSQVIEVLENMSEPQNIAFISVSDDDQGNNANISCLISTHTDIFSLTPIHFNIYSVYTLKPLDRETSPFYTLEVFCRDMGDPPLETKFDFNVNVSDQNDNKPLFTEQYYHAQVFENSPKGTFLLEVAAVDLDINLNGEVRYYLGNNIFLNGLLVIDEVTGVLSTGHQALDHEANSSISFNIEARDLGHPPFSSFVSATIVILDNNDNPPTFKSLFNTFHISENASPKSVIHRFETIDNDKTDIYQETTYSLSCCNSSGKTCNVLKEVPNEPGQERGRFLEYYTEEQLVYIVSIEGDKLVTNNYFDRETESVYHFCVNATNTHLPYLSTMAYITLEVDDVNDNAPTTIFPSPSYILEVSSWSTTDDNVIQIIASDSDEGENSILRFTTFQFDSQISQSDYPNSQFDDYISNSDESTSQNDFEISESNHLTLESDPTTSQSYPVSPQSFFSINESTGMVQVVTPLRQTDFWNNTSFTFNFTVSDLGYPSLSSHSSFEVMIFADDSQAMYNTKKSSLHQKNLQESTYNLFVLLILCSSTLLLIAVLSTTICLIRSRVKKDSRKDDDDVGVGVGDDDDDCKINPSQVFLVDVSSECHLNNVNNKIIAECNNNTNNNNVGDGDVVVGDGNNQNSVYIINGNTNNNINKNINNNNNNKNIEKFNTSPYNSKRHSYNQPTMKPKYSNFSLQLQHQANDYLLHDTSPSSDSGRGQSEMETSDTSKAPTISTINNRYSKYNNENISHNNHNYINGINHNNYNHSHNNQYSSHINHPYNPSKTNNTKLFYPNSNCYSNSNPNYNPNCYPNPNSKLIYGQERKDSHYGRNDNVVVGYCSYPSDRISEVSCISPATVSAEDPSCVETFI